MNDWTEPMKALCRGRCGDVGDPPCWELPSLSSDYDEVEPCPKCQADRIAELEAENARLREALQACAGEISTGFEQLGIPPERSRAIRHIRAALQENDDG